MAISVVQRNIGYDPNGVNGSVTATFSSANTAGNAIIVAIAIADTTTTGQATPTDTTGNTYTSLQNFSNGSSFNAHAWFGCFNIAAHTSGNVVTSSPDLGACNMHIWEVSGLQTSSALDQFTKTFGSTTSLTTGATATTTTANELLLSLFSNDHNAETWTLGSGWSNLLNSTSTQTNAFSSASEEKIVSATGAYTGTITAGHAASNLGSIMTFKGASAPVMPTNLFFF